MILLTSETLTTKLIRSPEQGMENIFLAVIKVFPQNCSLASENINHDVICKIGTEESNDSMSGIDVKFDQESVDEDESNIYHGTYKVILSDSLTKEISGNYTINLSSALPKSKTSVIPITKTFIYHHPLDSDIKGHLSSIAIGCH